MAKRKTKTRRKKRKSEAVIKRKAKVVAVHASKTAGHSPEATAANKKAMIKALGVGMNPGDAAEAIGVGRSTVFNWKKDDPEFSAAWDEARETSWDRAETKMYDSWYGRQCHCAEGNTASKSPREMARNAKRININVEHERPSQDDAGRIARAPEAARDRDAGV